MKTEVVFARTSDERAKAVTLLRAGDIVALPTETVYGLAADALNAEAVVRIFEAKERPRFDPLIVHLPDRDWLERIVDLPAQDRQVILKLVETFWPGPFTIVLPKRAIVPDIVTAGLDTVAVRISAHPVFAEIARAFGGPVAAPSANRFGQVSPTTAQHVLDELNGRIPLIVDAGATTHGIESTIVAVRGGKIDILRRGPITEEELRGMGFHSVSHRQDADATKSDAARARGIGFQPMSPYEKVEIRQGANLPHWTQAGATYAVTFRLNDSLPKEVLADWEFERRNIILSARQQKRELSKTEQEQLAKLFSEKIERYLDAGHGKCWLREERIATIVRDALLHFERQRYELAAWCIMPNHVHVLVRPGSGHSLSQILHSWKSFTAKEANRLLSAQGAFWQPESYDHVIRTEEELATQIQYVLDNPKKAGLRSWPWVSDSVGFQFMSHRQDADTTMVRAPGQLPTHYAPKTPLQLIDDAKSFLPERDKRVALLAWTPRKGDFPWRAVVPLQRDEGRQIAPAVGNRRSLKFVAVRQLSEKGDLREAAANLFRYLRELDALDVDLIVAERVPDHGLGAAIMDRLRRAAHRQLDTPDTPE